MFSKCCNSYPHNDKVSDEMINGIPQIVGKCLECQEQAEFYIDDREEERANELE